MTINTQINNNEANPGWVLSLRDLSCDTAPAKYEYTKATGETVMVTLKDRKRQVVDSLLIREIFCASTVRIGDAVFRLKTDHGLYADTETTTEGRKFYTLNGKVRRINGGAK